MKRTVAMLATVAMLTGCASTYSITPLADAGQTVRYDQGRPTTDQVRPAGAVKVTPVKVADDGRLVFAVAALNTSASASTFGVENIAVADPQGHPLRIYSHNALVREAKNRAMWASIATAVAGAAAAAAANSNAYRTTNASLMTPHGDLYTYQATTYDPTAAALGKAAATAGTTAALVGIHDTLDRTLAGLDDQILQSTTIDPDTAWGGKVVAGKLPGGAWPKDVTVTVTWNGETFPFRFRVAKET